MANGKKPDLSSALEAAAEAGAEVAFSKIMPEIETMDGRIDGVDTRLGGLEEKVGDLLSTHPSSGDLAARVARKFTAARMAALRKG